MKQVWKCDFCTSTNIDYSVIESHEPLCSFNHANKKCYTCEFSTDVGWDYSIRDCEIKLSVIDGEEIGNCSGWVDRNLQQSRDNKLGDLGIM